MNIVSCGHDADKHKTKHTTGYATTPKGKDICFACCGDNDRKSMIETGHSKNLPLYLSEREITNWPGTLRFQVTQRNQSWHNIARVRYDVWFKGPDNHIWHGTQYGDNTEIVHCKRTKETFTA